MPARDFFHSLMRIGPVQIGTHRDRNGTTKHTAVCSADGCGWSADYSSQSAAQLAQRVRTFEQWLAAGLAATPSLRETIVSARERLPNY